MAIKFRTVYELMDWAALRFDLNPNQRKELYGMLESHDVLRKAKSPGDEAVRMAKQIARESKPKAVSGRKGKPNDSPPRRAKPDIDPELDEDDIEDEMEYSYEVDSDDDSRWET